MIIAISYLGQEGDHKYFSIDSGSFSSNRSLRLLLFIAYVGTKGDVAELLYPWSVLFVFALPVGFTLIVLFRGT